MIKKLSKCIRQYKKQTLITPLLVVLEVILEVLIPFEMAKLIDLGIGTDETGGSMRYILIYGAMLLVSAGISMAAGMGAGKLSAVAGSGFAANLRSDMYSKIQTYSFSNIDRFSTGGLVTRLTTDVNNVQMAYMMIIRMAVRSPIMLVFSFTAAFMIDRTLSLVFLIAIPFLAAGSYFVISRAYPRFGRVFKTYDKLNGIVGENLRGIRVVKSFIREDHEKEKFGKVSGDIYTDFTAAEKTIAFNMPLMQLCIYGCMIAISYLGARMVVASGNNPDAGLSTGELMSLFTYIMQILMSLMILGFLAVQLTMARTSAQRIAEVLGEESDIVSKPGAVTAGKDSSVRFENVDFTYSGRAGKKVLDGINLDIRAGETIGIIGGTGSSKSSLVQLIPRLYDVNSGRVLVGGTDVRDWDIPALRKNVAVVLQKNVLFSGTIKENIRWGDENATDEEIKRVCAVSAADEFIAEMPDGYDTYIEQGGANVSGGQKQRLCIARALIAKPGILILDDSTSAVDTKTDARIRAAMAEELPQTTKIIIAQRLSSVMDADRIVVMDDGHIADCGTHDELLSRCDIYKEVYESQIKGGGDADEQR